MAPSILDDELERHEWPEPKVLTEDVQAILRNVVKPGTLDDGESVSLIADKARVSTRTVYRILNPTPPKDGRPATISLDLADRVCIAADDHVANCRLVWPDGRITPYH
jgi:hypothetical protein